MINYPEVFRVILFRAPVLYVRRIMKIFPKQKTDKEYIEVIRKSYKRRWWIFIPLLLISLSFLITSIYMGNKLEQKCIKIFDEISNSDPVSEESLEKKSTAMSYIFGFRIGFLVGKGLLIGGLGIIVSFTVILGRRKELMLLKYYNENNETNS